VERRIRNRQMDWLEIVVDASGGRCPFRLDELVNQWFDWNPNAPDAADYPPPAWTGREAACLAAVGQAMNRFCDATPRSIVDEAGARATPEWAAVLEAARQALAEMVPRGRLAED